ncbi:MAG TPA: PAS domain S-box protein [Candidatus Dormibacteraeota bacterium]
MTAEPLPEGEHEIFRAVFDGAGTGMAVLEPTGCIVRVNASLAALLGREADGLGGVPFGDLVDPAARKRVVAALQRATTEPHAVSVDHGLAGDTKAVIHCTVTAVRDSGGRTPYLILEAHDITPEAAPSRAPFDSEARFRAFVDSVADYAIFMLDTDGNVATWNVGAEKLKGYTAGEITGQHFRVFYSADAQARRHPEHVLELATRDGRYEEDGWRVRKDGTRFWASVVITALHNDAGDLVGFGKVTRDNTERHDIGEERERVSRTLAKANERLQKAADEKAEFVAITAHELRGPVQLMRGSAETLLDEWDRLDDPMRKRLLELMATGGNRLHRLLEDLLVVTRAEAGRLDLHVAPLRLRPLLEEAAREVDSRGSIEIRCTDGLAVDGDRGRLMQIVTNLMTNAMRYGSPPVEVKAASAGAMVEIAFSDNGPGVPDADIPKLFTKFANVRRSAQGTGLGLYIVRQLAQAHGGTVEYRRARGGGACFTVRVPAATRRQTAAATGHC